ncbi:1-deoxy-D-xylulose 5-phosphate reductoisomerase [Clostridium tetanomorphum DSM 665]|uniref:1-deoxy-D-xylulose 5-phosphate reductoisomerase n=1 Tax=Clostridium tetanomorphum TaxID=1553 RepID=A0A923EBV6_CLOTT|nr:1-deoxy-D-xylulose-5-phosphate reductoisomerase [Clostridium tetanomorphum]KAJ51560.1 1-deoxy-D-xylulose 5-phosphate reductoisomerase [Clostridium tetanomorphum DSM 665]MBC2398914.1 1-deoxy-D-xylulose-5-phosphate reductoisomerase [Clostridium tetanomorphum]
MKNICILGGTGSIGSQALDVIRDEKDSFSLIAVSANKNWKGIINIINEFSPKFVALMDSVAYEKVKVYCNDNNKNTEVLFGLEGLNIIASLEEVDVVLTSVVGMIGLYPTLKAIKSGKDIALANKETLVVGGEIIKKEAKKSNINILPVDSEHGAIFQCLRGNSYEDVNKILLTASGGPFRGKTLHELKNVTVEDALNHPRWNMGKKISIDSATLMNKGLEVIEAHFLFDVDYNNIQVIVHPESIIHSMVEYKDGSVIAQLGSTDMKLPIQYALNYPKRKEAVVEKIDFYAIKNLTFEKPDIDTFKPLKLAYDAGKIGGLMPAILNGANEAAVELFINKRIDFLTIGNILEEAMNKFSNIKNPSLEEIIYIDKRVKEYVNNTFI